LEHIFVISKVLKKRNCLREAFLLVSEDRVKRPSL
jgi:hypothetical protein